MNYVTPADEQVLSVLSVVMAVFYLLALACAVADYVMVSLSLYRLAKNRGIRGAWLAWIPIGNYWIIGCLANAIDAQRDLQRKWNKNLLTLAGFGFGGVVVAYTALVVTGVIYAFVDMESLLLAILPFYIILLLAMVVTVVLNILSSICVFKIFEAVLPQKAVKYMVLYLLVPLGAGVCFLKTAKADNPPMEAQTAVEEVL